MIRIKASGSDRKQRIVKLPTEYVEQQGLRPDVAEVQVALVGRDGVPGDPLFFKSRVMFHGGRFKVRLPTPWVRDMGVLQGTELAVEVRMLEGGISE